MSLHKEYRADIDGLRAIAIISVLIFHGFPTWLPGGFVGVDVFFVISGYLITSIILKSLYNKNFSIFVFYERRIRRLFPVLVVVLFFTLMLGWFLLSPIDYKYLAKHTVGGAAFIANILLAADSGYFSDVSDSNPLLHLWSLGIEEQFYLFWPLILWFFYWRKWPIWIGILICFFSSLFYGVYLTQGNIKLAFYLPVTRFWELIAGAGLAWVSLQPWSKKILPFAVSSRLADALSVLALCLFLFSLYLINPSTLFPGWYALLPVSSAFLFIAAGRKAVINNYFLSNRVMVWVGLISYPAYLWHWPLLAYFNNFSYALSPEWHVPAVFLLLALSLFLGWLSYRYIEMPLRGGGFGRIKLIGLVFTMLLITAAATVVWVGQGMPSRIDNSLRQLLVTNLRSDDWKATLRDGECHNMFYHAPATLNDAICLPTQQPSLVLWGDSHAASLYEAFRVWGEKNQIAIGQVTTDATAPYINAYQRNNMGKTFEQVAWRIIERLKASPPSVLVLHAFWVEHGFVSEDYLSQQIENVLAHLRIHLPETKVVIIGPVPNWKKTVAMNVFNYSVLHGGEAIPQFTTFGLNLEALRMDELLKERWLPDTGVNYLSAINYLCNEDGCLFRLGDELRPENMAYVDESHIGTKAAFWLVDKMAPALLPFLQRAEP